MNLHYILLHTRSTALEMREVLKPASVTMPQGEDRLLSSLLNLNMWKLQSKIVSIQAIFPQVTQTRTQENFTKFSIKDTEVPY